jgi:hypothetical protein
MTRLALSHPPTTPRSFIAGPPTSRPSPARPTFALAALATGGASATLALSLGHFPLLPAIIIALGVAHLWTAPRTEP